MSAGKLQVRAGADRERVIDVSDRVVLGRDGSADVVLDDEEISRRHCEVTSDGDALSVKDLGSSNGTFVNEQRITSRRLAPGDRLRIGKTVLEYVPPTSTPESPSAAPIAAADATQAREIAAPDRTQAREIASPDRTQAREIASPDRTQAREIVSPDRTQAREIVSPDRTRARPMTVPGAAPPPAGPPGQAEPGSPGAAAASPIQGQVRILSGPIQPASFGLRTRLTVGREPGGDIVIPDEEVSRQHLVLGVSDGEPEIIDLNSTNGTFLNGERLIGRRLLHDGDRIELGSASIAYVEAADAAIRGRPIVAPQQVTSLREAIAQQPSKILTSESSSRKWWTLLVVCSAVFMLLLDTNIVAVALPSISQSLGASFSQLQWVIDAYSLGLAVLLLTAGSISDVLGRRHVFVLGLATFTVFSAVCGLAWSPIVLDVARGIQAIGGAMMFATSLALIAQEFPPAERGMAFSVWGATTASAVAIGPLVGGALTEGIGWEAIFYVNVPIGIAAIIVTVMRLKNLPGTSRAIDVPGAVLFTIALFAFVFALIRGNDEGWGSTLIIGLFVASAACMIAFVAVEQRSKAPMLQLSLFRKPTFEGVSLAGFAISGSAIALVIYITLWLQSILGYSPLEAGLRMLPLTALALLVSPMVGRFSGRVPARLTLGLGLALVGIGILTMGGVDAVSKWTVILPGLVVIGVGMGLTQTPLASAAVGIAPPWQAGMASGINSTFRQVGLSTGIAALGAVFEHTVAVNLKSALAHTSVAARSDSFAKSVAAGGAQRVVTHAPTNVRVSLQHAIAASYTAGLVKIFLYGSILALVGAVGSAALVRSRDSWRPPVGAGGPPAGGPPGGFPGGGPRGVAKRPGTGVEAAG